MTEQERYSALEQEKQNALNNSNKTYEDLLNKNQQYSSSVNDYLNKYQTTQNDIYDKQTQFQVDLQNQNKEKAEKEYQKEAIASKNAYYDFVNPYGVQAEIQAQNGLNRAGYSETAKSQAWTTQQNRTAQAKASMNEAKLQFDNAIKEAYLNNDVNKANLALQILQQQQDEMLRSFNYVSDTKQNQLSNYQNLDSEYNNRYNTLYSQIQQEKATQEAIRQWEAEMAEQQRQYNEQMAYQKELDKIAQQQWQKEYELSKKAASSKSGSSSGSGGYVLTDGNEELVSGSITNPYTGTRNKDADNGTFSNGYQPNNVNGSKLSKTGKTVSEILGTTGNTGSTGINIDNQNVWTVNDKYYVWDGTQDKYIDITSNVPKPNKTPVSSSSGGGASSW